MSLIEVLFDYAWNIILYGREKANERLHEMTDESLWSHIEKSVNDEGAFIGADGKSLDHERIMREKTVNGHNG
jgi:hypothetical protein